MSWPWARKVLVPLAEAVTLGEGEALAGGEAGPLDEAAPAAGDDPDDVAGTLAGRDADATAELLDELQAVTSKAAQANTAQTLKPMVCRVLRAFVVNMISTPQFP